MSDQIGLTHAPLAPAATHTGQHGAVIHFSGIVRGTEQARTIKGINYTAYEPMAEQQLQSIVAAARLVCGADFPTTLIHRLGVVPVGVASVILEVAAPHSKEAFAFCQDVLARLKAEVPIWKEFLYHGEG